MTNNKMNFGIIGIYIGMMILIILLQAFIVIFRSDLLDTPESLTQVNSIINLFYYVGLFLIFIIVYRRYFSEQINFAFSNKRKTIKAIAYGISFMFMVSFLANVVLTWLGVTDTSQNQASLNEISNGSLFDKISLFVFAVLLAPIVEEFVFRKAVYSIFEKFNYIIAIVISAFLFGFMHVSGGDYIQIIYYAALGIMLGVIYHFSKNNIIVPMVVHLCFNLFVTTMMFLG
ncbi:MAG: CPBP family intramembrane metalloprotease [Bacilli bacterium]|nr:CPBP family intramembrane metalloprotease [Bacilli bacterium]